MIRTLLALLAVVALAAAVGAIGIARWDRDVTRMTARLNSLARAPGAAPAAPGAGGGGGGGRAELPAPVRRYLAFALAPGQRPIVRARVRQAGEFATKPGKWSPFTATQHFTIAPPGLVWDASIRMLPLFPIRVRDSYVAGVGRMFGRVAGLVTVVDMHGTPEMASATLQRWLAEAAWFPTALLPSATLVWTAVDDSTARATLTDGATRVSVDFHFGPGGEITGISTQRYRDANGTPVLTPWSGRFRDYRRIDGMMVPTRAEVGWVLPEGYAPYWRGHLSDFSYEF